jgi:hypothetical protein
MVNHFTLFSTQLRGSEEYIREEHVIITDNEEDLERIKAGLASNIRGALSILESMNINSNVTDNIRRRINEYIDSLIMTKNSRLMTMKLRRFKVLLNR